MVLPDHSGFTSWALRTAGLPGLDIPIGFNKDHMPIGAQIIANDFDEVTIYKLASYIEKELGLKLDPRKVK